MVWICGSLQQQQLQPVLRQRGSGPCPCAGHKWPVKSQRPSWISAFSFHQLQNICHSCPTPGKVTPASLKNKDKLMFLHQLCLRNEWRAAAQAINSSSTLLKFAMHCWGFLSDKVICSSCCRFVLLLNMCSADFPPNESFKNICKIRAKLNCWGFMKLQSKVAGFKQCLGETAQQLPDKHVSHALTLSTPSS